MARAQTNKQRVSGAVNVAAEGLCRLADVEGCRDIDLLLSVLRSMPDIVFYKDTRGVYLGCNQLFAEFVGRSVEEIVGHSDDELFGHPVAEGFREIDRLVLDSLAPRHHEEWITYRDGHRVLVDTFKTPLRDAQGKVVGLLGVSRDITERKRAEERLRQSEQSFASFFDSARDFKFIISLDGRIQMVNRTVCDRLGYTTEELVGRRVGDVHPPEQRDEAERVMAEMVAGRVHQCDIPLMTKDGVLIPVETRVSFGAWHGMKAIFGASRDVSQQRRTEQHIRHLNSIQHQLMLFATEFVNVPIDRIDEAIRGALAAVGGLIEADRAYLFGYDFEAGTMSNTHEWCAEGVEPQIEALQQVPNALFPVWVAAHLRGELVHIPRVADIPKDDPLYQVLAPQGIQSLITLPLSTPGGCLGYVGFDAVKDARVWGEAEVALLRVLAEVFANFKMRHRSEAELAQMNAERGLLLDTMNAQVWYLKDVETYGLVNRAHADFMGRRREDLQNRSLREFLPPDAAEICMKVNRDVFSTGRAVRTQEWLVSGKGERRLIEIVKTPSVNKEGQVSYVVCVGYDITEKARLQEELVHERDKAEQNARLKATFLADMSHEIRTPLNVILGYLQIMERECVECPQKRNIRAMNKSGEHLMELINDILALIQKDSSNVPLSECAFDLFQMVDDVRVFFERQAQAKALRIETSCTEGTPRYVCADKGKIRQVLLNLVGNAVKFTEQGVVRIRLGRADAVSAEGLPETVFRLAFDVEDSGCGISEEQQEAVFEVFFKADAGAPQKTGSGLGLPLSRRYAQAMGGDVTVKSREGRGSVFRFVFCARPVDPSAAVEMRKARWRVRPVDGVKPRVLVVDDNPAGRDVQVVMLETAGFIVDVAESGERALACLRESGQYHVILLDKRMPGMDGLETLKRIRALPASKRVPIILMTASGFSEENDTVRSLGGDGVLPKPVAFDRMLEEIGRVTGFAFDRIGEAGVGEGDDERPFTGAVGADTPTISVPDDLRERIGAAVRCGDVMALRALVVELRALSSEVAAVVEPMVDAYDYDGLRRFLQQGEKEPDGDMR